MVAGRIPVSGIWRFDMASPDKALGPQLRRASVDCEAMLASEPGQRDRCILYALPTGKLMVRGQTMGSRRVFPARFSRRSGSSSPPSPSWSPDGVLYRMPAVGDLHDSLLLRFSTPGPQGPGPHRAADAAMVRRERAWREVRGRGRAKEGRPADRRSGRLCEEWLAWLGPIPT